MTIQAMAIRGKGMTATATVMADIPAVMTAAIPAVAIRAVAIRAAGIRAVAIPVVTMAILTAGPMATGPVMATAAVRGMDMAAIRTAAEMAPAAVAEEKATVVAMTDHRLGGRDA